MICPVQLASEMSVFQTGHGKGSCRRRHELLRCDRPGVDDESAGSDLARDGQEDHLVASGREVKRHFVCKPMPTERGDENSNDIPWSGPRKRGSDKLRFRPPSLPWLVSCV